MFLLKVTFGRSSYPYRSSVLLLLNFWSYYSNSIVMSWYPYNHWTICSCALKLSVFPCPLCTNPEVLLQYWKSSAQLILFLWDIYPYFPTINWKGRYRLNTISFSRGDSVHWYPNRRMFQSSLSYTLRTSQVLRGSIIIVLGSKNDGKPKNSSSVL